MDVMLLDNKPELAMVHVDHTFQSYLHKPSTVPIHISWLGEKQMVRIKLSTKPELEVLKLTHEFPSNLKTPLKVVPTQMWLF
jgi:hypothetical protein